MVSSSCEILILEVSCRYGGLQQAVKHGWSSSRRHKISRVVIFENLLGWGKWVMVPQRSLLISTSYFLKLIILRKVRNVRNPQFNSIRNQSWNLIYRSWAEVRNSSGPHFPHLDIFEKLLAILTFPQFLAFPQFLTLVIFEKLPLSKFSVLTLTPWKAAEKSRVYWRLVLQRAPTKWDLTTGLLRPHQQGKSSPISRPTAPLAELLENPH